MNNAECSSTSPLKGTTRNILHDFYYSCVFAKCNYRVLVRVFECIRMCVCVFVCFCTITKKNDLGT